MMMQEEAGGGSGEEERYRAVLALDEAGPSALDALVQALHDESWRIRKAAAERMASLPGRGAVIARLVQILGERGQPGARNAAAEALVRLGDESAAPLIELLGHPDPDQRKFAADILGQLAAREAEKPLVTALDDPDLNVCVSAAEALGQIGGELAGRALERLLARPEPLLQLSAIEGLVRLRRAPPMPAVAPLVTDPRLQRSAYRVLGLVLQPAAAELICKGLHSEVRSIREAALSGLGLRYLAGDANRLGELEAALRAALRRVPALHEVLASALDAEDLEVRIGALFAAGALKEPRLAVAVAEAARDDRLTRQVAWTLRRLGAQGGKELLQALSSLSSPARAAVTEALVDMVDVSWTGQLLELLDSGEVELQLLAVRALGRFSSPEAAVPLLPLLDDPAISHAAARALLSLGERFPEQILPRLEEAIAASPSPAAILVLARLGGAAVLPALKRALREPDPLVRAAAAEAAGEVEGDEALGLLRLALADEAAQVRAGAVRALGRLSPQVALPLIQRALSDEDTSVQAAAIEAAGESGAPELAADLERLVSGPDGLRASRAVRALARLGKLSAQTLWVAARHPDPEVAKESLGAGAALPESVEAALELLSHPRWDVRVAAARVLGSSGGAACIKAVSAALAVESDPIARKALGDAAQRLAER